MFTIKPLELPKTEAYLRSLYELKFAQVLNDVGAFGVMKLSEMTPEDTGETASAWGYNVESGLNGYSIIWTNSVMAGTTPLAVLINYGHATGTGGYVSARNFIGPAMNDVLSQVMNMIETEVRL
jgi:hypothetical protein